MAASGVYRMWIDVQSSNLRSIWYDPEDEELLKIQFKDGRIYAYSGVPASVFLALLHADSKGKYHAQHIKWKYAYSLVGG